MIAGRRGGVAGTVGGTQHESWGAACGRDAARRRGATPPAKRGGLGTKVVPIARLERCVVRGSDGAFSLHAPSAGRE